MAFATSLPKGINGLSLIGGQSVASSGKTFAKRSPIDDAVLGDITLATDIQIEAALTQGWAAYIQDTVKTPASRIRRAEMLEKVAEKLEQRREDLRITYFLESALPSTKAAEGQQPCRFDIEFNRTVAQLRFHAKRLRTHTHFVPSIDKTPFGIIAKTRRGIGPVLVLGAINFPLAFSTAGGDFADAWASGCPVIMKAHAEHPITSEIVASCIIAALQELGMHQGWFSLVHCERQQTLEMVDDDRIKAVAITGSLGAAEAIKAVADQNHKPVFAECGSINPVFLMPEYLAANAPKLATEFLGSLTGGVGQFCTCPGLVIAIVGAGFDQFTATVAELVNAKPAATMLSTRTKKDFLASVAHLKGVSGMSVLAGGGEVDHPTQTKPVVLTISGADFLKSSVAAQREAFGHCSVIIKATNMGQVLEIATALAGNLTTTRYGTDAELASADGMHLRRILEINAGRNIANAMPTGVAVCGSMTHGGPFPACTINATSVGGSTRFMAELSFQGVPDATLPEELQASNPASIMRLVDGVYTTAAMAS